MDAVSVGWRVFVRLLGRDGWRIVLWMERREQRRKEEGQEG
jgi:hypothetical protein